MTHTHAHPGGMGMPPRELSAQAGDGLLRDNGRRSRAAPRTATQGG